MKTWKDDPFEVVAVEERPDEFTELTRRHVSASPSPQPLLAHAATAKLHGFDLEERPLLLGLPGLPHEIVAGRSTVALLREQVGSEVVVLFEQGDVYRPIVVGVVRDARGRLPAAPVPAPLVSAQVDDQKVVLTAEREIVLKCGEASITLTRAGKVLIKGTYVLSRSSGYNKIKGAAVDIN
jgi:Domain of unknown function (DUF6484)